MKDYYVPLSDDKISLLPLTAEHVQSLKKIGSDPSIWTWFSAELSKPEDLEKWMTTRLEESERGEKLSYVVQVNESNALAGSSSYGHLDWNEHVLEIGWTWLGSEFIGSGINKHMKFLMLSHAFDTMGIKRVEIRTDEINVRSRKAIEKIGAQLDGILRSHRTTQGGRRRNTAIYSIIKDEWSEIRNRIFGGL